MITATINKQAINDYILTAICTDGYDVTAETVKEKLQFLADTFRHEYSHKVTKAGFADWIGGLPSSFNIDFANHTILEMVYLFDIIDASATENDEDESIEGWFKLITDFTADLFKQNQIDVF